MSLLFPIACFLAGLILDQLLHINERRIAQIILYFAVPIVMFYAVYKANVAAFTLYAGYAFFLSLALTLLAIVFYRNRTPRHTPTSQTTTPPPAFGRCITGCLYGYANIGWFGLPIATSFFGLEGTKAAAAMFFGGMSFGYTIGYALLAWEHMETKAVLGKIFKMPVFHFMLLALLLRLAGIPINDRWILPLVLLAKWTLTVLGMGLAGVGLARALRLGKKPWQQAIRLSLGRFAALAVLNTLFLLLAYRFGIDIKYLTLFYLFPIAANVVVFAAELNQDIRPTAAAVGASTVLSILLLPIYYLILQNIAPH